MDNITLTIRLLANSLSRMADAATEAYEASNDGRRNEAIGSLPSRDELREALSLLDTVHILHRTLPR